MVPVPTLNNEIRIDHEENIGVVPYVNISWLTPGINQPDDKDLSVLAAILGDGIASKLQEALTVQTEQAQEVNVSQQSLANVGVFSISAVVRPGVAPEDVINTIQSQLDYLNDAPVTPEEVTRAVNQIETSMTFSLEMGFVRADVLQNYNHFNGDPGALQKELDEYRAVTADSVMAAQRKWLPKDHRAILVARPAGTAAPAVPPADAAAPGGAK